MFKQSGSECAQELWIVAVLEPLNSVLEPMTGVCVCACVCVRACMRACVCACVCERLTVFL